MLGPTKTQSNEVSALVVRRSAAAGELADFLFYMERLLAVCIAVCVAAWIARRAHPLIAGRSPTAAQEAADQHLLAAAEAINAVLDASNGAEAVSLAELGTLLRVAGADPSEYDIVRYRQALRDSGAEAITVEWLAEVLRTYDDDNPPAQRQQELQDAWHVVDQDGDGVVRGGSEMRNLIEMITTLGEPLTDEETAEFIAEVDGDGDGDITRAEFMRTLGG